MEKIDNLKISLRLVQEITIGFATIKTGETLPVIAEDKHTITTFEVLKAFGSSEMIISKSEVKFVKFPNNKSLSEMLNDHDPMEYFQWYKSNFN